MIVKYDDEMKTAKETQNEKLLGGDTAGE